VKWYIFRHAEKEKGDFFNPVLRHQDEPVSPAGLVEAQKLWQYFMDKKIDGIFISQYKRTGQTIEYCAKKLGVVPETDSRLNEIDNGLLDGLSDEQVRRQYPEVWQGFIERSHDFQFPNGESGEDARLRIDAFIREKQRTDKNLIIVCHEGLIRLWICHILGLPVYQRWDFRVDSCGTMEIEFEQAYEKWRIIRFNQKLFNSSK
jgi:broad specificity phosphatase PhoE